MPSIRQRLLWCHAQLTGPTGRYHRAAILAAIDRLLDDMLIAQEMGVVL
jgi:hypothetical protein